MAFTFYSFLMEPLLLLFGVKEGLCVSLWGKKATWGLVLLLFHGEQRHLCLREAQGLLPVHMVGADNTYPSNSFIESQFTYCTIYSFKATLQWFPVYSRVVQPSPQSILQHFYHPPQKTLAHRQSLPISTSPTSGKYWSIFCLMDLPINIIIQYVVFFHWAYCFKVHPHCSMYQYFTQKQLRLPSCWYWKEQTQWERGPFPLRNWMMPTVGHYRWKGGLRSQSPVHWPHQSLGNSRAIMCVEHIIQALDIYSRFFPRTCSARVYWFYCQKIDTKWGQWQCHWSSSSGLNGAGSSPNETAPQVLQLVPLNLPFF